MKRITNMKKIFKYFGVFLSIALMTALTACSIKEEEGSADLGLGIKVFFPTKVVAGQPMTINGSGFSGVKEIVFPDGVTVTNFELVSGEMIRVNAPSGIAAQGGKLIVRSADDQAESRVSLTLGETVVSGFSLQDGETINGGDQLTIFGKDLEFISRVELLDTDGNPLILEDEDFYRKGTSSVVITIPKKTIYDGTFVGKMFTIDGKEFNLPELTYVPASEGGHWETVRTMIWEGDGSAGAVSWSGTYRFAGEGFETGEEIAIIGADTWARMKSEPFYVMYTAADPSSYQVRITTGWWSVQWLGADNDIAPWNMAERIIDNEDGTFSILVDFSEDPAILDVIDVQHMLITGNGFTPVAMYFETEEWVGGGHWETVKTSVWKGDGSAGAVSWSGTYRFAGEGFETGEEIAIIDAETWARLKSEPFYVMYTAADPSSYQVRITTGWWSVQWLGADNDIAPWNMAERIIDNEDGTFKFLVDFSEDPAILDVIDVQHLLITGNGFTPVEIFFEQEIWVEEGGDTPKEVTIWEGDGSAGAVSWSGTYRFAGEGFETGEEIAIIPADLWAKLKSVPFFVKYTAADPSSYQVRVTTGWWSVQWLGADNDVAPWNMAERIIDNGDGTFCIQVDFSEDPAILDVIDVQHLLITGNGFTPLKLFYME